MFSTSSGVCRRELLEKLYSKTNVDFNEENIYAIVIWVIKNANQYFDDQLKEIFLYLTEPENIKNYKSNQKTWHREEWRYNSDKKEQTHYTLDYRIIIHSYDKLKAIKNSKNISRNTKILYHHRHIKNILNSTNCSSRMVHNTENIPYAIYHFVITLSLSTDSVFNEIMKFLNTAPQACLEGTLEKAASYFITPKPTQFGGKKTTRKHKKRINKKSRKTTKQML